MYLTVDTFNNFDDLPEKKNFSKPYLIKGGCKNMKIFNEKDKSKYFYDHLQYDNFNIEIYNTRNQMAETNVFDYINISFQNFYEKIMDKSSSQLYYLADCSLDDTSEDFKNHFIIDYDKYYKNEGLLLFFGINTLSGCHFHTANDYILNQIIGKKTVYMFDYQTENIEYCGIFNERGNFVKDNFFEIDHSKMNIYKIDMDEGDSLIIPPWWLHAVEGFDVTVSITKTYSREDFWMLNKYYILAFGIVSFISESFNNIISSFFNILFLIEENNIFFIILLLIIILILKKDSLYNYIKTT